MPLSTIDKTLYNGNVIDAIDAKSSHVRESAFKSYGP